MDGMNFELLALLHMTKYCCRRKMDHMKDYYYGTSRCLDHAIEVQAKQTLLDLFGWCLVVFLLWKVVGH